MAYCTKQDMIDRFGEQEIIQLTDRLSTGVIDDVVLDKAITDAAAEINPYLSGYNLPLIILPNSLIRISCDMARYYLYDDNVSDTIIARYESALKFLLMVANGTIMLGIDDDGKSPEITNSVVMDGGERVFTRKDKGFI